eukprot:PLAT12755.1.p1 GENE.PLAT12755.1~~PLAT12755.1.p1  ORF type:complete len:441 (+),score=210.08 PLAT12755.1:586-1908(+)
MRYYCMDYLAGNLVPWAPYLTLDKLIAPFIEGTYPIRDQPFVPQAPRVDYDRLVRRMEGEEVFDDDDAIDGLFPDGSSAAGGTGDGDGTGEAEAGAAAAAGADGADGNERPAVRRSSFAIGRRRSSAAGEGDEPDGLADGLQAVRALGFVDDDGAAGGSAAAAAAADGSSSLGAAAAAIRAGSAVAGRRPSSGFLASVARAAIATEEGKAAAAEESAALTRTAAGRQQKEKAKLQERTRRQSAFAEAVARVSASAAARKEPTAAPGKLLSAVLAVQDAAGRQRRPSWERPPSEAERKDVDEASVKRSAEHSKSFMEALELARRPRRGSDDAHASAAAAAAVTAEGKRRGSNADDVLRTWRRVSAAKTGRKLPPSAARGSMAKLVARVSKQSAAAAAGSGGAAGAAGGKAVPGYPKPRRDSGAFRMAVARMRDARAQGMAF